MEHDAIEERALFHQDGTIRVQAERVKISSAPFPSSTPLPPEAGAPASSCRVVSKSVLLGVCGSVAVGRNFDRC